MGLFDKIFGGKKRGDDGGGYFKLLTAYTPVYSTWQGGLYESELVRAAIDARARHISKLKVEVSGSAKPKLQARLKRQPNLLQTWSQFLYRVSTILDMHNTAFIVPVYDGQLEVTGFYPVLPQYTEIVDVGGEPWLRYTFASGDRAALPMSECAVLTKHQYKKDFFGEPNEGALSQTMDLLSIMNNGVRESAKNSATFRFMAQTSNFSMSSDTAKEAKRFTETQFRQDGDRAILLFPNTYQNIRQIDQAAYTVDTAQVEYIRTNVFNFFGVNENILQNKADGTQLDAFFNGAIEPFAIQFSEAMTAAAFTERERAAGASVTANANRLQYMDVGSKVSMAQQLGDRGAILIDEIRELFNYPPLPDGKGQHAPIRGEYYMAGEEPAKEAGDADQG